PARRFAAQGRSYICFGPVTPVRLPLPALSVPFDIEGCITALPRARAYGTGIIGPKQMWERPCAAKRRAGGARFEQHRNNQAGRLAALMLSGAEHLKCRI
ncbi:hypothetical protein, partial [Pseudomonas sp. UBA800]|uniref:hypothetical protein n=1 Tax=Pseudomonas sp. UBA800 TaxID=1947344 RepID=UPI00257A14D5